MHLKTFLVDVTALLARGSVVIAFMLLFIQIGEDNKTTEKIFRVLLNFSMLSLLLSVVK